MAQQADRDLGDDQTVGGVDAALGKRARMRRATRVGDLERLGGEDLRRQHVGWAGMDHQREVLVGEDTGVDQCLLAVAALLGRRPDHAHPQPDFVGDRGEADRRTKRGRGNDVVPARVANLGQRVVLGDDGDVQRPRTARADERRFEPAYWRFHRVARFRQFIHEPSGGQPLLVGELRVGVDSVAELDEAVTGAFDLLASALSCLLGVHDAEW